VKLRRSVVSVNPNLHPSQSSQRCSDKSEHKHILNPVITVMIKPVKNDTKEYSREYQ
jgi:hypothetical protein